MHAANLAGHIERPLQRGRGMTAIRDPRSLPVGLAGGGRAGRRRARASCSASPRGSLAVDRLLDLAATNTVGADQAFTRLMRDARPPRRRTRRSSTWPTTPAGPRRPRAAGSACRRSPSPRSPAPPTPTRQRRSTASSALPSGAASAGSSCTSPPSAERRCRRSPSTGSTTATTVRDGHHRVSVARAIGADAIDAHVVELLHCLERRTAPGSPEAASQARGVGLEPTTLRLTAECSAIELPPTAVTAVMLRHPG